MKNSDWLTSRPVAHRGLHDNKSIPENSMVAFKNAIDHDYGIEFDVYLTDDNKLIIHHDDSLKRMCGIDVFPEKIDTSKLEEYKLLNTNYSIPLFLDFLKLVDGKVNLICEIKTTKKVNEVCEKLYDVIKDYKGNFCVESFDPKIVNWWYKNHKEIILGQLYTSKSELQYYYAKLLRQYKKVDFLAINVNSLTDKYFLNIKKKYPKKKLITWTVRTNEQLNKAKEVADNFIFESIIKNDDYINLP